MTAREGANTQSPDVVLRSGGTIWIRVVDKSTKKGLPFVGWSLTPIVDDKLARYTMSSETNIQGRSTSLSIAPGKVRVSLRLDNPSKSRRNLVKVGDSWYDAPTNSGEVISNQRDPRSKTSQIVEVEKGKEREVIFELQRVANVN